MNSKQIARPYVLLTNDDGIHAEGIRALAEALEPHFDLLIVAPSTECSGQGHAISVLKDMHLEPYHRDANLWGWGLCGTPADCVKVAVTMLAPDRPFDLVISGINRGQNAGINVLYSGTVAAAREGAILGLPSVAISLLYHDEHDIRYETAARVGLDALRLVQQHGLPKGMMLNVNVPALPYEELKGWAVTRMGDSGYSDLFHHEPSREGRPAVYRNVGKCWNPSVPEDDEVDDHALNKGYVAVTPLQFDLTAYDFLPTMHDWFARSRRMDKIS
jgi:5'-nucleotidase